MSRWRADLCEEWNHQQRALPVSRTEVHSMASVPCFRDVGHREFLNRSFRTVACLIGDLRCQAHYSNSDDCHFETTVADFVTEKSKDHCLAFARLSAQQKKSIPKAFWPPQIGQPCVFDDLLEITVSPDLRWLVFGMGGAVNKLHCDIWNTATWNLLLLGQKQWLIVPPDRENGDFCYYHQQRAGEIVFIPSGWKHEVIYDEPSIAATQNYVDLDNAAVVAKAMESDGQYGLAELLNRLVAHLREDRAVDHVEHE